MQIRFNKGICFRICVLITLSIFLISVISASEESFEQGEIVDFLDIPHSAYPSDTTTTVVKEAGYISANAAIANIPGMEGVRGTWSAEILDNLDGGTRIKTRILQAHNADIQLLMDSSRADEDLEIVDIAYEMDIATTQIGLNEPAQIEMSVPRQWVNEHGGLEAIRIFRYVNDRTADVLTTRFLNYDRDTGYINLKSDSPDGLGMFALVAVRQHASSQPDTIEPERVRNVQQENIISETHEPHVSREEDKNLFKIQVAAFCLFFVLFFIGVARTMKPFVHKCNNLPVFGLVIRMIQSSNLKR